MTEPARPFVIGDRVTIERHREVWTVVGYELGHEALTLEGRRLDLFRRERICVYAWRLRLAHCAIP